MTRLRPVRRGLSILEVLIALMILLLAIGAINQLMTICSEQALTIHQRSQAARLAQSLLAEVAAGSLPIQGTASGSEVPDDPDYTYTMTSESNVLAGLYTVTITVSREMSDGRKVEYTLRQMMLDPAFVGSNQDQAAINGAAETTGTTTESTGTGGTTTPSTGGTTTPGTTTPSGGTGGAAGGAAGGAGMTGGR